MEPNPSLDAIRIRASSWSELFDCAKRWQARNIDQVFQPTSVAAHLGTSVHASTAAFDAAKLAGSPISANEAAQVFVDTLHDADAGVAWTQDDPTPREAEAIGLSLHAKYCATFGQNRDYTHVELTCDPLDIDCGNGVIIRLTGTTDRVRRLPTSELAITDLKTGMRRVNKEGVVSAKTDRAQLGVYMLLAERQLECDITGPSEIIGMSTATGTIGAIDVPHARDVIIELLPMAAMMLKSGIFPPNPSSNLCSMRYCPIYGQCRFHN